ncbi:DEAD/DEAH box helicase [Vibrio vulnificus]|uniref:DEAD/DEAH box helicase n=1 Tax=Vibrio vulnificus TaxID=672 RepID=UPI001FAEDD94|nr:DEAD/DEAH box helicase [Vibrio vulnificus]ELE2040590.1 DEAD/DEAH box helicase [Vibrio vulnificus]MCJ0802543.1 DEAD/DEAH box helicase [Vibrio vulnificus]MDS1830725.1 DEAD/DEAH box helicase [Vibrio vulnificus]HDY7569405.1 DEAD/DEAH box helicase [Vibrio vulnificus]
MNQSVSNKIEVIKKKQEISLELLETLLIDVYRLLDSKNENDYNLCLSAICHVANYNSDDLMVQQLLHDCIVKSRVFLYGNLLEKINENYCPNVSYQDNILRNFYTSRKTNTTLTKPQKEIFDGFQKNRRLIVSAPTSFGKTRIVREIILHNNYKNIAFIMPTVSLLSEQYQELRKSVEGYEISKSSKVKIDEEKNYILVLTPERMAAFLEENKGFKIDFFVMDEIYKVDYKLNDDRFRVFSDILYRLAKTNSDFYLAGPYISDFSVKFREKFNVVLKKYATEIVQKDYYSLDNNDDKGVHSIESGTIKIIGDKFKNLLRLVSEESIDGKFLIYRYQKQYVEDTAKKFLNTWPIKSHNKDLIDYLSSSVSPNWDLISCIKRGIAFHHGAMPRHIQDLVVDEFNDSSDSGLNYLFCTTSLTEGINSAAKNVVIYDKKIGTGDLLKTLDRKNIEGRAGRFMQHFIGRVFHLETQEDNDEETFVEIEYLDNSNAAIETLIQLDVEDVPEQMVDSLNSFDNKIASLGVEPEVIRENKFVQVDGQLNLIEHLRTSNNLERYFFREKLPDNICLTRILSCCYDYLFTDRDKGKNFNNDVGKSILINLTKYYIYYSPSFKDMLNSSTVQNARNNDNSRIRYVFDLMSKYFEFSWPKYIKTFLNIYNFVALERNQETISLDMVIAKLEYGTIENHEIILRDSGVPNEIVKKLSHYFKDCETYEDIYKISRLKNSEIKSAIHPIEAKILDKYI